MRRWFQVRLRTALAAMLLLPLPLAWFANARSATQQEEAAVADLSGGLARWNYQQRRWHWLGERRMDLAIFL